MVEERRHRDTDECSLLIVKLGVPSSYFSPTSNAADAQFTVGVSASATAVSSKYVLITCDHDYICQTMSKFTKLSWMLIVSTQCFSKFGGNWAKASNVVR